MINIDVSGAPRGKKLFPALSTIFAISLKSISSSNELFVPALMRMYFLMLNSAEQKRLFIYYLKNNFIHFFTDDYKTILQGLIDDFIQSLARYDQIEYIINDYYQYIQLSQKFILDSATFGLFPQDRTKQLSIVLSSALQQVQTENQKIEIAAHIVRKLTGDFHLNNKTPHLNIFSYDFLLSVSDAVWKLKHDNVMQMNIMTKIAYATIGKYLNKHEEKNLEAVTIILQYFIAENMSENSISTHQFAMRQKALQLLDEQSSHLNAAFKSLSKQFSSEENKEKLLLQLKLVQQHFREDSPTYVWIDKVTTPMQEADNDSLSLMPWSPRSSEEQYLRNSPYDKFNVDLATTSATQIPTISFIVREIPAGSFFSVPVENTVLAEAPKAKHSING
ncbi:MAG: hypothetical protein WC748_06055 [Legionellales bacterium]